MGLASRTVRLGFARGRFPEGTHICQIFSEEPEREEALTAFLLAGLLDGDRAACFSEKLDPAALAVTLGRHGLDPEALAAEGRLALAGTREVYFQDGRFDPDRMLQRLDLAYEDAAEAGRHFRVIGEMSPEVCGVPGGDRLMEYECRVSLLIQEKPVTAVCQYGAAGFDGATLMDVLRVHPMMVVRGEVVHNPFYLPPADYLAR